MSPVKSILSNHTHLSSLCKKTPTTALLHYRKLVASPSSEQAFTTCKLLEFKNFETLVFDAFLAKTEIFVVFLLTLSKKYVPVA
jgi:hypothetical protein